MISFEIERKADELLAGLPDDQADRARSAAQRDVRYRLEFWSIAIAIPATLTAILLASLPYIRSFPPGSPWRLVSTVFLLAAGWLIARSAYPVNRARLAASVLRVLRGKRV